MKNIQNLRFIAIITFLVSSCNSPKEDQNKQLYNEVSQIVKIENDFVPLMEEGSESFETLKLGYVGQEQIVNLGELYDLPDSLALESSIPEIFGDYHNRNFITGVADKYNIIEALGHLYEKDERGKFQKVSLKKLITGKFEPKIEKVDKVYFENILTDSTQIKAGIKFLNIEASKSSKVELLIKDELTVLLPDGNKDFKALKKVIEVLGDRIDNLYFSYGATLSSITHKTYNKSAWRPAIDASWFTFSRDKHRGQKSFSYRSDVHVDLIALGSIIFPNE